METEEEKKQPKGRPDADYKKDEFLEKALKHRIASFEKRDTPAWKNVSETAEALADTGGGFIFIGVKEIDKIPMIVGISDAARVQQLIHQPEYEFLIRLHVDTVLTVIESKVFIKWIIPPTEGSEENEIYKRLSRRPQKIKNENELKEFFDESWIGSSDTPQTAIHDSSITTHPATEKENATTDNTHKKAYVRLSDSVAKRAVKILKKLAKPLKNEPALCVEKDKIYIFNSDEFPGIITAINNFTHNTGKLNQLEQKNIHICSKEGKVPTVYKKSTVTEQDKIGFYAGIIASQPSENFASGGILENFETFEKNMNTTIKSGNKIYVDDSVKEKMNNSHLTKRHWLIAVYTYWRCIQQADN